MFCFSNDQAQKFPYKYNKGTTVQANKNPKPKMTFKSHTKIDLLTLMSLPKIVQGPNSNWQQKIGLGSPFGVSPPGVSTSFIGVRSSWLLRQVKSWFKSWPVRNRKKRKMMILLTRIKMEIVLSSNIVKFLLDEGGTNRRSMLQFMSVDCISWLFWKSERKFRWEQRNDDGRLSMRFCQEINFWENTKKRHWHTMTICELFCASLCVFVAHSSSVLFNKQHQK